jgi:acyl-CoA synthetase (AMP-forming)/AMP-acid ligase II
MDSGANRFLSFLDALHAAEPWTGETTGDENDVCTLMYTSGTSGRPKGVLLRHQHLVTVALGSGEMASAVGEGAVLVSAPCYHVAGFTAVMNNLYLGRRLVLLRQFDADAWLKSVASEQVSHTFLIPTMMRQILDSPAFHGTDLSSLRLISYGAAPMPLSLIRRALEQFPQHVGFVQAFGQTETTGTITILTPEDHRSASAQQTGQLSRLASVGRALDGVEIVVASPDGTELKPGEVGEILIRSDRTMKGYHKRHGESDSTLNNGWHNTGDLGFLDEDSYLYLSGRKSDLIIRGGENISPEEVEGVLASHPFVNEAAVFGVPDEYWGEEPHAAVVLNRGQEIHEADLIEFCREKVASYKRPRRIHFLEALPKNQLGKVLRRQLKAQFSVG